MPTPICLSSLKPRPDEGLIIEIGENKKEELKEFKRHKGKIQDLPEPIFTGLEA